MSIRASWTLVALFCFFLASCDRQGSNIDILAFEEICRESNFVLPNGATILGVDKHSGWFVVHSNNKISIPPAYNDVVRAASEDTCLQCLKSLIPNHDFGIPKNPSAFHAIKDVGPMKAVDFKCLQTSNGWYLRCTIIDASR